MRISWPSAGREQRARQNSKRVWKFRFYNLNFFRLPADLSAKVLTSAEASAQAGISKFGFRASRSAACLPARQGLTPLQKHQSYRMRHQAPGLFKWRPPFTYRPDFVTACLPARQGFTPSLENGMTPRDTRRILFRLGSSKTSGGPTLGPRRRSVAMPFFSAGFTMVEIVIILGIIVMISAILLANFPGFSQAINLQRSSQQLALAFRKTQSMALAVREVDLGVGGIGGLLPGHHTPSAYGVSIDYARGQSTYIVFADFNAGGGKAGVYDPANDYIVETASLVGAGIFISSMVTDPSGANQNQSVLNIAFSVPTANMNIQSNGSQVLTAQVARFELRGRAALSLNKKTVTVVTTGQIAIK